MKKNEPKLTISPSPARQDYKVDARMAEAMRRARRDQPELMTLSSNVPAYTKEK